MRSGGPAPTHAVTRPSLAAALRRVMHLYPQGWWSAATAGHSFDHKRRPTPRRSTMVATNRSIAGRGTATAAALLAGVLLGPATAVDAAGGPTLRVTPRTVPAGSAVVIRGRHWPVIEFCRPRVTVTIDHRLIGRIRPRPEDGSFALRWTVPA